MFLNNSDRLTLKEAYSQLLGDPPQAIPFLVWLLENSGSPLPIPGRISLKHHDYLHTILDLDFSTLSEAFVVGFAMGSDERTSRIFIHFYKLVARFIYPQKYRFPKKELRYFENGFLFGRNLPRKRLNSYNFEELQEDTLKVIRDKLEIDLKKVRELFDEDAFKTPSKPPSSWD